MKRLNFFKTLFRKENYKKILIFLKYHNENYSSIRTQNLLVKIDVVSSKLKFLLSDMLESKDTCFIRSPLRFPEAHILFNIGCRLT